MQRYEMVEGGASKFWEVDLAGTELRVRFGRIGSTGQEKVKSFADAAAAQKEYEKLVREKTGKGYGLVVDGGGVELSIPQAPQSAAPPPQPSPGGEGSSQASSPASSGGLVRLPAQASQASTAHAGSIQPSASPAAPAGGSPGLLPPPPGESWGGGAFAATSATAEPAGGLPQPGADCRAEDLPPVLRSPPWLLPASQRPVLPTLAIALQPRPDRIAWPPGALQHARAYQLDPQHLLTIARQLKEDWFAVTAAGRARLLAGEPLRPEDLLHDMRLEFLFGLPAAEQLPVWNGVPGANWGWGELEQPLWRILAEHGTAALPGLHHLLAAQPDKLLAAIAPVDSQRFVPIVLRAFRQLKKARDEALRWIRAHADTVLSVALPAAFAPGPAAPRDDARHALQWFVDQGRREALQAAAATHGPAMADALAAWMVAAPQLEVPARPPKLPAFFVPAAMQRPVLREGRGALPLAAVEHLATVLAMSTLERPCPGLAEVKAACTPQSLAGFAWDLAQAWLTDGGPPKEAWAFTALGLLGDDDTARRLAPRIRDWPAQGFHARAVTGLDVLAAIGTDVALMHLNAMADKLRHKPLQDRARARIAQVAEARGLSPAELGDRLVPDLGLADDGALALDFGPRRFTVHFDEQLRPFVRDANGGRLKDLPKPLKSDDAALAQAAIERYKQVKKDARAIAGQQISRLELAMVERRRWRAADFRVLFLEHPLMRHLAGRLLWGVYRDAQRLACFRVAEDGTLADAADRAFTLPADALVGLCHVLELDASVQTAFGQLFADYEILQPFRQLGRETYALTPAECEGHEITRFARSVPSGAVLGLLHRGWRKDHAESGCVGWLVRALPGGLEALLELDPGLRVGMFDNDQPQALPKLVLRRADGGWIDGFVPFSQLEAMVASELLRDIDLLAPTLETE